MYSCILLYFLVFICALHNAAGNETLVQVEQGWLSGEYLETSTGDGYYYSFKGIPYAHAPIGSLRFKAPEPPISWDGIRNATEHGSECPQVNIYTNDFTAGSEDCLFLNVYTPKISPTSSLPVMVFIHGGGYQSGSGNVHYYGPDFLVVLDVVVVTLNYRLGVLGFLSMDTEEIPGNAGMKDQVAALKWVQRNIAKFGGDPDTVTIFGQSAGGSSVALHLTSPLSKGLFKRAISMSGVPYCDFNFHYQPRRRAFKLAQLMGLDTDDEVKLLEFLQSVNSSDLVSASPYLLASEEMVNVFTKMYTFTPSVEKNGTDNFWTEDARIIQNESYVNEADIMFGYTNKESLIALKQFEEYLMQRYETYPEMLVPVKILFNDTTDKILEISDKIHDFYFGDEFLGINTMKEVIDYATNVTFVYDIQRFFASYPKTENKMFFYKFTTVSNRNVYGVVGEKYGIVGASHQDDLMYLFDAKSYNLTLDKNSTEYRLVRQTTLLFTNFAKYGNPTPDSTLNVTWPEFDAETINYLDLGNTLIISETPDEADVQFWKSIFEYANIPFY